MPPATQQNGRNFVKIGDFQAAQARLKTLCFVFSLFFHDCILFKKETGLIHQQGDADSAKPQRLKQLCRQSAVFTSPLSAQHTCFTRAKCDIVVSNYSVNGRFTGRVVSRELNIHY